MQLPVHKFIGALVMTNTKTDRTVYGTGVLISPNIVLTAAHNIFDTEARENFHDVKFYLGQMGILDNFFQVESHFFPPEHRLNPKAENDWALLKLKKNSTEKIFLPLRSDIRKLATNGKFFISGYPEAKYNKIASIRGSGSVSQWGFGSANISIEDIREDSSELIYNLPAMKGQGGAPVICVDGYNRVSIVGIHRGGLRRGKGECSSNCGVLLT